MKTSLTIKGILILSLIWIFNKANINLGSDSVNAFFDVILGIGQVVGIVMAYIGRVRKGDITLFGQKN